MWLLLALWRNRSHSIWNSDFCLVGAFSSEMENAFNESIFLFLAADCCSTSSTPVSFAVETGRVRWNMMGDSSLASSSTSSFTFSSNGSCNDNVDLTISDRSTWSQWPALIVPYKSIPIEWSNTASVYKVRFKLYVLRLNVTRLAIFERTATSIGNLWKKFINQDGVWKVSNTSSRGNCETDHITVYLSIR